MHEVRLVHGAKLHVTRVLPRRIGTTSNGDNPDRSVPVWIRHPVRRLFVRLPALPVFDQRRREHLRTDLTKGRSCLGGASVARGRWLPLGTVVVAESS